MKMCDNYQSMDKAVEQGAGSWKNFFTILSGKTNGAHRPIVDYLRGAGHYEVDNVCDADYLLVFCPIASRVGTDISEALEQIPADKPTILVVMHHSFDRNHTVAESRRQVTNPKVCLTVDYLFFEHELLDCSLNQISRGDIEKFLQISSTVDTCPPNPIKWLKDNPKCAIVTVIVVVCFVVALVVGLTYITKKHEDPHKP